MSISARAKFAAFMDSTRGELEFEFDHLLLALGSETNFFDNAGIRDWAVTMKNLSDAALLRNRIVAFLEEATLENRCGRAPAMAHFRHRGRRICRRGNGRRGERFPSRDSEVLSASGRRGNSCRGDSSGRLLVARVRRRARRYAERKMRERKVEVIKGARVASYDGWVVTLNNGLSIPAATLVWTAGVKPSPVVAALPCRERERTNCCR